MALKISFRSDIETFRALDNLRCVNEKIANGEDIIRLEAGQPCFGVPQNVLELAKSSIDENPIQGYTDALGTVALRKAISSYYKDYYDQNISYERIGITAGSSPGLLMTFLACFDADDKIALCTPTYAAYKNIIKSVNLDTVFIQTDASTNFQPTLELLQNAPKKFDGIIINSPSNPAGTIIDEQEFEKIISWCEDNNIRVISDEAYHRITYGNKAQTACKFSDEVIVLNTFSKFFAMTGWRLGWFIVPENLISRMKKLSESLFVSPPTISQQLALGIFEHLDELDAYVAKYKENHDIMLAGLPESGLTQLSHGEGAFYLYVNVSEFTDNSEEFCKAMLEEAGVSATSGVDFDPERGHHFIRMSYAGTPEDMKEACQRLKNWLRSNSSGQLKQSAV